MPAILATRLRVSSSLRAKLGRTVATIHSRYLLRRTVLFSVEDWNQLEVMMVDALAVANPSQSLATRGSVAIGVLAAQAIPPLQPMSKACRLEQLNLPGRRAACEALVARMEQSSTVLTQGLALSIQERWWPAGSPERDVLRAKRRRLDYLLTMSGRIRWWRMNRDMAVRIDAARKTDREEDVELAMIKSFGLPPEPPMDWKDTLHP